MFCLVWFPGRGGRKGIFLYMSGYLSVWLSVLRVWLNFAFWKPLNSAIHQPINQFSLTIISTLRQPFNRYIHSIPLIICAFTDVRTLPRGPWVFNLYPGPGIHPPVACMDAFRLCPGSKRQTWVMLITIRWKTGNKHPTKILTTELSLSIFKLHLERRRKP